jgi:hypothetical protein
MRIPDAVFGAEAAIAVASAFAALVAMAGIVLIFLELWREMPARLLKLEYTAAVVTLLAYLVSILVLRLNSPDVHVRLFIVALILVVGLVVAFTGAVAFRASRFRDLAILLSALAPLTLIWIRFIDR